MPKKLLVADKSVVIQKSVGITFAQEDYSVSFVSDGEDALQKSKQLKPDLLLIHTGTPKLSGYEVCAALRKDPELKAIPVLLLVGIHEQLDETQAKSCGANGHMIKPFESQSLIDKVRELLSKPVAPQTAPPPTRPQVPPAQPYIASPSSTIAGQAARAPAKPFSSPSSTISGQSPLRSAPMLDLNVPVEETKVQTPDSGFDFALDDSFTSENTATNVEAPPPIPDPIPAATEASGADIWDFGSPAVETAPVDNIVESETSEIAFVEPETIQTAEPSSSEPAPAAEFGAPDSGDFGFGGPEEPTVVLQEPSSLEPTESVFELESPAEMMAEETASFVAQHPKANGEEVSMAAPSNIQLSDEQLEAIVSKVFKQVIERIAWEVVPGLAETIIKEELKRLTQDSK